MKFKKEISTVIRMHQDKQIDYKDVLSHLMYLFNEKLETIARSMHPEYVRTMTNVEASRLVLKQREHETC